MKTIKRNWALLTVLAVLGLNYSTAQDMGMSMYTTSEGALGFTIDANFTKESKVYYGMAMLFYQTSGVGESDYSNVFGPNAFRGEIYETVNGINNSAYAVVGYRVLEMVIVKGLIGATSRTIFYNGYDPYQILSPSGYYYTSQLGETTLSYGVQASIQAYKGVSLELGTTNQDGFSVGVGYRFKF